MKERVNKESLRKASRYLDQDTILEIGLKEKIRKQYQCDVFKTLFILEKEELRKVDHKARKWMTMHKNLHLSDDVDRLYTKWKAGRRNLASVEDCVGAAIK